MSTISYCISVCNEARELDELLGQIVQYVDHEDEIILLVDESKVTGEVGSVISKYRLLNDIKVIGSTLNKDFATFKNNFISNATKDYIIQIDADELLSDDLLVHLKSIISSNPQIDLYWIPRENYVEGITPEHIARWGWRIDEKNRINYPDTQARIFKNNKLIKWVKPVHEMLEGYMQFAVLPGNFFLIHKKTIERQESQNNFYNTI